ncbi:MAG TPA: DNAase [Gammaproteobacteria bacterium]|jgi:TatD DNase family protein|nr:TatD family hydrolase [Pseudomonadota bacterium]HAY47268.1 DNAase [Gammaproteobacteria bacterium]
MKLVDSHCHINFPDLAENEHAVLENARLNGVGHMLCVSVNLEDFPQVLSFAERHKHIFASVGIHPNEPKSDVVSVDQLIKLASHKRIVAIGETGLDYFRSEGDLKWQHERFTTHIEAGKETGKPLIIHTRDAASDTMKILKESNASDCGGVMHCFSEDWDVAKKALDIGFYISMSGIVTFKNATKVKEVAERTPLDKLLVETDAPFLAPVPFRGKTNEPAYVKHTAEYIAELRGISFNELAEATTENFFRLFSHAEPVAG